MYFLIESSRIFEDSIVCLIQLIGVDHTSTTESSNVGKFIEIVKGDIKGLQSTPGESCHCPVFTVGQHSEAGFNVGDDLVQQDGSEVGAESASRLIGVFTEQCAEVFNVSVIHHHYHRFCFT